MKQIKKHLIVLAAGFLVISFRTIAQPLFLPNDKYLPICFENVLYSNPENHTIIRPVLISEISKTNIFDSCFTVKDKKTFGNWFFNKNFISVKNEKNGFSINPIITDIGSANPSFFTEHGLTIETWLGKKLAVEFSYSAIITHQEGNIAAFHKEGNIAAFVDTNGILPHFGKVDKNKYNYLYQNITGYASWQVADFMNLQVGRDKVFWSDGYRSLFISDNSNAYPFFKGTVNIWKVKYIILYSFLHEKSSLEVSSPLQKKYSASHILSWNIGRRLNFNMFETVIWREQDSLGNRGFDVNYLNPVIFFRPVEFSLGSPDNVIMGFGFRMRMLKTTHLYGQFLLDEFKLSEIKANKGWWGNKFGIQAGIKTFNLFGIKNLYALAEANIVRPFTYSHNDYFENNGNYNQPLAHPLGANFAEGIAQIRYEKGRWFGSALIKVSIQGTDYDTLNMGYNIYRSYDENKNEYGNKLFQGSKQNQNLAEFSIGYLINPLWFLTARIGYRRIFNKFQNNPGDAYNSYNQNIVFLGLYTAIGNREGLF